VPCGPNTAPRDELRRRRRAGLRAGRLAERWYARFAGVLGHELRGPGGVVTVVQPGSQDRFVVIQEALDGAARQLEEYAVQQRYHSAARSAAHPSPEDRDT
jgi:hypothetical protein